MDNRIIYPEFFKMTNPLPYHDTKPVGAADFYFAINATFRFIRETLGAGALTAYWQDLGREYMDPVSQRWKAGGLPAVAEYWRAFFAAEPGAEVEVHEEKDRVILDVQTCPAIRHLRAGNRTIDSGFCQHCYYVSEAAAEKAGLTVRVKGGNGQCLQTFFPREAADGPQKMEDIEKAS
jgi:hypothetical protein